MPKLAELFLFSAAVVCNGLVLVGSQGHPSSVCVLTDAPTQCGAFCQAALNPLIDDLADLRNQFTTIQEVCDRKQQETKSVMDEMLEQTRAMLNSIKENTKAMFDRQHEMNSKLTNIETKLLQTLGGHSQQPSMQDVQIVPQTNPTEDVKSVGSSRWKLILEWKTWYDAETHCQRLGGHLAVFQNNEEVELVTRLLDYETWYNYAFWLGIHNLNQENEFVSVNSGRKAQFLDWAYGEPNNRNGDCVQMFRGNMKKSNCAINGKFICQLIVNN